MHNNSKIAFPPIVTKNSKILILGTMPGERSLRLQQYYGHAGNHFWRIMFQLYDVPFSMDYKIRTELLLNNNIALWDVLQSCEGNGSADSSIKNEVANNFVKFYDDYPNIKKVYFSSQKAESYYDKYIKKTANLQYYKLPSPSSANTWKTFNDKLLEWSVLKQ